MNVGNGAIIRASDVSRGQQSLELAADVVIVGSGASGATAARVLSEAGLDVVLVEEGPYIRPDELRSDVFTNARRVWRDLGFQLAEGRSMIGLLQGVCVGGSTAINGAIVHRLPEAIWDNWRATTPIEALTDLGALHRVYDQLDHELSVAPAPDEVLGRNNELMREACANLGWQGNPIRRNVSGCRGSAHCLQGCPTERRQSMDVSYVPRALRQGARLVVGCRVGRVRFEGARAVAVEGELGHDDGGSIDVTVRARTAVCLAASAVQTPNILRKSGLGRRYPWLGRAFQAHPGSAVLGVFDDPVNLWFGATQGYESTHFWHERMKFETLSLPLELMAARLPDFGPDLRRRIAELPHVAHFVVQIRARAKGRVDETWGGRTRIRYGLDGDDVRTLKLGVTRLCEMLFAAGAREVLPGVHGRPERIRSMDELRLDELDDDPRLFHCIATHMFGTARLGGERASGVVGPDGRVHETEGLYVLDSSVFPSNLGVNPQHTIAALAWLIASRIAERKRV